MRIGLLGATGYTGRLTAAELHRRGVTARLGGRDPNRLASIGSYGEVVPFDTEVEPAKLALFLEGLDAVISCVGPFDRLGRAVLSAAVANRVPYVDSSGEPAFLRWAYETFAEAATPVVPACGMDYVPGDLAAAIAAEELAVPVEHVVVGYAMTGTSATRGTARSAAGALGTVTLHPRRVRLPFPGGARTGLVLPWGEELTIPRHLPGAQVESAFVVPEAVAWSAPALALAAPLLPLAGPLLARLAERLPEGPPPERRELARADVLAVARGGGREARVLVSCRDVYGLTAQLLVEAALRLPAAPGGARTPAQAFPARAFLDSVQGPLLSWRVVAGD
ncbi:MAG TPA: NAD(P)H-binding protein [Mycobacteriales bacterium]|nr:NAD(P)H-binding protein [Mycobacteriales bacterium]